MSVLKLVSLNIERSKHLDRVLPFLERERPDVFCVQELHEVDIPHFEKVVGPCAAFAAVTRHFADPPSIEELVMGSAIFTRHSVVSQKIVYYRGSQAHALSAPAKEIMEDIPLVVCDAELDGTIYRSITTHFTWTQGGAPTEQQRIDVRALVAILGQSGDFVLCGDFNAPRGGEIWTMLTETYHDNIPPEYKTSLDVNLHRAGKGKPHELANKMVDGLFTTPGYRASNVRLEFGVSDHAAIIAAIEKAS